MKLTKDIDRKIFREYDIRGVYPRDIDEDIAYTVGRSFGSYVKELGHQDCVVGHDNRYSSEELTNALMKGITESGVHVLYLGLVTTPMYYYACLKTDTPRGIMVTASHNPKDDNGFKIAFNESGNAKGEEIQKFYEYTVQQNFQSGFGIISRMDIQKDYISYLKSSIQIQRPLKVVIDCGNGTTSILASEVFEDGNIGLITLYGDSNPEFPNHHPDPSVDENMVVLSSAVKEFHADVGLAFDGDGDRVGVVDDMGRIVRIDQLMALFVRDLVTKNQNHRFLYDVKCGFSLIREIEKCGAEGVMVRTGNSYTKALTREKDCIFGGEYSGHVYFRDKFLGFDSGLYAGLRVLELLGSTTMSLSQLVDSLETFVSTPELKFASSDGKKFEVIEKIKEYVSEKGYPYQEIDGVRVEFEDAWVSVRASNTGPNITMRVEASSEERKEQLLEEFQGKLEEYNS